MPRARRTEHSDSVLQLPGGNEDNDLWTVTYDVGQGGPAHGSTWVFSDEERAAIAAGENIELIVHGDSHPAVSVRMCNYVIGRKRVEESR